MSHFCTKAPNCASSISPLSVAFPVVFSGSQSDKIEELTEAVAASLLLADEAHREMLETISGLAENQADLAQKQVDLAEKQAEFDTKLAEVKTASLQS